MPIQAAANRLKKEIESGNTVSEDPKIKWLAEKEARKAEEAKKAAEESKEEKKDAKKGKPAKVKEPECPSRKYTQYEILQQIGLDEAEIPKFTDAIHWLEYFPPQGLEDLKDFGVCSDWRRSFITT